MCLLAAVPVCAHRLPCQSVSVNQQSSQHTPDSQTAATPGAMPVPTSTQLPGLLPPYRMPEQMPWDSGGLGQPHHTPCISEALAFPGLGGALPAPRSLHGACRASRKHAGLWSRRGSKGTRASCNKQLGAQLMPAPRHPHPRLWKPSCFQENPKPLLGSSAGPVHSPAPCLARVGTALCPAGLLCTRAFGVGPGQRWAPRFLVTGASHAAPPCPGPKERHRMLLRVAAIP